MNVRSVIPGAATRPTSRCAANGFTFTAPSTSKAKRLSPTLAVPATSPPPRHFSVKRSVDGGPRVITLDGFEPTHAALRRMGMNNEFNYRWEDAVQIRTCPYLNNVVEQDHRRIKARVGPMLGFKRFFNARRVVAGVELVQKIIKGQFDVPESFGNDPFAVWYNVLAA
jgi:DDE domain